MSNVGTDQVPDYRGTAVHVAAGDALTRRGLEEAWHAGKVLLTAWHQLGLGWYGWLETCTHRSLQG